jgi:hypothetical protein
LIFDNNDKEEEEEEEEEEDDDDVEKKEKVEKGTNVYTYALHARICHNQHSNLVTQIVHISN